MENPRVNVDILVVRDGKILLGLLTEKWSSKRHAWGVPGREIHFGEKIGDTAKRNIREEFNAAVKSYKIISVNANYELGNHYIGIGVVAEMDGEPKLLLPEDWKEWRWFKKDEIPKNLFTPAKNLIECYFKNKISVSE